MESWAMQTAMCGSPAVGMRGSSPGKFKAIGASASGREQVSPLTSWFKRWSSRDQRKAERQQWPPLVAHYWTGGAPAGQRIRDISSTGFYLLTEARWYPGTVVKITLQSSTEGDGAASGDRSAIAVQSRVVRRGTDGVGLEFILPGALDRDSDFSQRNLVSDRKDLDRFLERLGQSGTEMLIDVE